MSAASPWPEEAPRLCIDCGKEKLSTKKRISLPGAPLICGDCFEQRGAKKEKKR